MSRVLSCLAVLAMIGPATVRAQATVQGAWEGAIHVAGQTITMRVDFTAADKATIDIQGATGLTGTNVKIQGDSVHFELIAGAGLCVFEGTLKDGAISGTFTQGPAKGTFELSRAKPAAPEPPPPYNVEEVTITNGAIKLAGTLTVPPTPGRHPAVVLITGSGAENRDEEVFGFKVFRVLADQLTRQGIAVLRCDDRGVGGSTGSTPESTSEDFATDVLADVAYLASRRDIDAKRIGLVGHSEGGLIAPMVAARRPSAISFIVLMSGPAVPGDKILLAQGERLLKIRGAGPEVIARQAETQRKTFEAVRTNSGWDELEKQAKADIDAQAAKLPDSQRQAIQQAGYQQVDAELKSARSPWFRFFLAFDPATVLTKVRCPVLAFYGELDFQVSVDVNQPALEQALAKAGNRDVTVKLLPKANHLYEEGKTGDFAEYATLKKEFVPELVPAMTAWIQARVQRK
jgi:pimeloyl-ACP methyl ester carboxylesterase